MTRRRLPPGTSGSVSLTQAGPNECLARARVRLLGGAIKEVQAQGKTQAEAKANLALRIRDRLAEEREVEEIAPVARGDLATRRELTAAIKKLTTQNTQLKLQLTETDRRLGRQLDFILAALTGPLEQDSRDRLAREQELRWGGRT